MIICCGEALIDMLPRQLPDGQNSFLPVVGGAIFNTAIALGRLGEETGFLAGISTDLFGDQLIEALENSNVDTQFCMRVPNLSTLAVVKLTDGNASYTFYDENSATQALNKDMLVELPDKVSALHFGAISLIPKTCGTAYEALLMREASERVISLDPNIRTSFIDDEKSHRARIERMIGKSDIVKVSDEDLDWIAPGKNHKVAIKDIIRSGVSVVLLTKGAKGVSAFTGNREIEVESEKVDVVDTIGAGDTFNAGFLFGLKKVNCLNKDALKNISDENLVSAVKLASKVAAITVSRAGANPPWANELES